MGSPVRRSDDSEGSQAGPPGAPQAGGAAARAASQSLSPPHPAFDPVSAREGFPQVLLIGDSISIDYTEHVRGLLAKVADVHRPAINCESTLEGLRLLDGWLGSRKWAVIHFNWGLHDLKY
jgi:acyl-CoA thioesterase-1